VYFAYFDSPFEMRGKTESQIHKNKVMSTYQKALLVCDVL